jgi:hypothetical protein
MSTNAVGDEAKKKTFLAVGLTISIVHRTAFFRINHYPL